VAAGATWAVFEVVVWSKVPAELVGKWEVQGGPQDGARFEFSRNGKLEAHFNDRGMDRPLYGTVAVDGGRLHITTRNPHTQLDETRSCAIREMSGKTLVVEFEKGELYRMVRVQ
jgi:uncharacterized protein (TIGR03066 family)